MNIALKIFEEKAPAEPVYKPPVREPIQQPEAQPVISETSPPAQPEYEAAVGNGTILF